MLIIFRGGGGGGPSPFLGGVLGFVWGGWGYEFECGGGGGGGGGPFTGALPLNLPEDGNVQKQHYS